MTASASILSPTSDAPASTSADLPSLGAVSQSGDEIEGGLLEIIKKYLKSPDANWTTQTTMEEAQIDSLDLVELVFEIEDRFDVEVNFNANSGPVGELTFGNVVDMIRTALAKKAHAA